MFFGECLTAFSILFSCSASPQGWHHSQEAQGGWHFSCGRYWFNLHLLWYLAFCSRRCLKHWEFGWVFFFFFRNFVFRFLDVFFSKVADVFFDGDGFTSVEGCEVRHLYVFLKIGYKYQRFAMRWWMSQATMTWHSIWYSSLKTGSTPEEL